MEETLVLIKPDGVQKKLVGEVLNRFERVGLEIVGLKVIKPTEELLENHYPLDPIWVKETVKKTRDAFAKKGVTFKETDLQIGKKIQTWLKQGLGKGLVIAMVLRGNHAVEIVRKLVGNTEPRQSLPGTIRGDFSIDSYELADKEKRSMQNIVHASGSVNEAKREINVWFKKLK